MIKALKMIKNFAKKKKMIKSLNYQTLENNIKYVYRRNLYVKK